MNPIAPFQPRIAWLKWRKMVPLALQGTPFCAFVELTSFKVGTGGFAARSVVF